MHLNNLGAIVEELYSYLGIESSAIGRYPLTRVSAYLIYPGWK
jgi:hypothetical protein